MDSSFAKTGDLVVTQKIIEQMLMGVNTAIPGTIRTFNALKQTATVIPNIKSINHDIEGNVSMIVLPELIEVPCYMPCSSTLGLSITIPITQGDQCLLIFSQRSIDNWLAHGGVADPVETIMPRHHSLCDAIALVGLLPNPNAVESYKTDAIEIRNKDRSVYVKVSAQAVTIKSPIITLDGDVVVTGAIQAPPVGGVPQPALTAAGIKHGGKTIDSSHQHSGVTGGTGNSGGVT